MKQHQEVALFDMSKALSTVSLDKPSCRLFSSAKAADVEALGLLTMRSIREDLKSKGIKGEQLSVQTRETFFKQLGAATVKGKTMEATFESRGAQLTNQRIAVSKNGTIKLTSTRSQWVPVTPSDRLAVLKAKAQAAIAAVNALESDLDVVEVDSAN